MEMNPEERLAYAEQAFAFYAWMLSLSYLQPPQSSLNAYIAESALLVTGVLTSAAELANAALAAIVAIEERLDAFDAKETEQDARLTALEARVTALETA